MLDRETVDIICRALLAIVAALRKKYNLPAYRDIVIVFAEKEPQKILDVDIETRCQ